MSGLKPKHVAIGGAAGYAAVVVGMMIAGEWGNVAGMVAVPSFLCALIGFALHVTSRDGDWT